jgi:hypothetical protein
MLCPQATEFRILQRRSPSLGSAFYQGLHGHRDRFLRGPPEHLLISIDVIASGRMPEGQGILVLKHRTEIEDVGTSTAQSAFEIVLGFA